MKKLLISFFLFNSLTAFSQTAPPIQWQNTIGGSSNDDLFCAQQTSDGGYILGGRSLSGISGDKTEANIGSNDYWVIKIDSTGNIQWQNTIGGDGNDVLVSIAISTDGGYILGGSSASGISGDKTEALMGTADIWIVKLNAFGNIQWQNTIGGNLDENVGGIKATSDGGCIIGGNSNSDISGDKTEANMGMFSYDYWVIKLDPIGNIQWQNTIGGSGSESLRSIQISSDGGYIIVGDSDTYGPNGDKLEPNLGSNDFWVVKLDATGNILWQNTIGGNNIDFPYWIENTPDNGYIIGGDSRSDISGDKTEPCQGLSDYWVVKLDSIGNIQWQNTIGGDNNDILMSVKNTFFNGYILAGISNSSINGDKTEASIGGNDYWIVKLDVTGNIQWQNTIGGTGNDLLRYIISTPDSGYFLGGQSSSGISGNKTEVSQGGNDFWVIKLAPECFNPTLSNFTINDNEICVGDSAQLTITGDLQSAEHWTIYSGSCGGTLIDTTSQNSIWVHPTADTDYFVRGEGGCVTPGTCFSVSVTVNNLPIVNAGTDSTLCIGATYTLNASGANSYSWNQGVGPVNPAVVSPTGTLQYNVTGIDVNGCISSDSVIVNVNSLPVVSAGLDTTICTGSSANLLATGANTYSWNQGIGAVNPAVVSPTSNLHYTVTGTDVNGCINIDSVLVNVNSVPVVNAGFDTTLCIGSSYTLNASGANNYSWNHGIGALNPANVSPTDTLQYTVIGTDINGCTNTDSVIVNVNLLPNVFAGNDTLICEGFDIILNASGADSYEWIGLGVGNPFNTDPLFTDNTFVVQGTDLNGCVNIDSMVAEVSNVPGLSFSIGFDSVCTSYSTISLSGSPLGGTFSGPGVTGNQFNPAIAGAGMHTITYTFTNGDGCSDDEFDVIMVSPCLGIDENEQNNILLFPNPASDYLNISSSTSTITSIEIVDLTGRKIKTINLNTNSGMIDINELTNGTYLMNMITENGTTTKRFIKH